MNEIYLNQRSRLGDGPFGRKRFALENIKLVQPNAKGSRKSLRRGLSPVSGVKQP
jgi:hypothetical protein